MMKTDWNVIWSSTNGAYISKTNFEVRENGYWLSGGGSFSGFITKEEARELLRALSKEFEKEREE
jgi:hypothetical protein